MPTLRDGFQLFRGQPREVNVAAVLVGYVVATNDGDCELPSIYGDRGEIGLARGAPLLAATSGLIRRGGRAGHSPTRSVTGLWLYFLVILLATWTVHQVAPMVSPGKGDVIPGGFVLVSMVLLPLAVHYDSRYVKTNSDWDTDVYWWLGFAAFPAALLFAVVYLHRRRHAFGWRATVPRGFPPMAIGRWHFGVVLTLAYWVVIFVAPEWNAAAGRFSWLGLGFAWLGLPLATYLDVRFVRERSSCRPNATLWVGLAFLPGLNLVSGLLYLVRRYEVFWLVEQA